MKRVFLTVTTICLLAAILLAGPTTAHAQSGASLTAAVDRNRLTTDETLTLTLSLATSDISMPQLTLPALDGFQVVGSSQSMQTSLTNGGISINVIYTYQLQPLQAGEFTIPAFSLDWNGQPLSTDPIQISVIQGSVAGQPPAVAQAPVSGAQPGSAGQPGSSQRVGSQDLFIETSLDKQSLYVGEPLKFSLRLYNSALSFAQPTYDAPKFVGFWHPQEPGVQQFQATSAEGIPYDVTELTTWLFPTNPGQATIDPATVTVEGSFFSRGAHLQSEPISIEVKPLPAGAPANFNGAVGQFQISAAPDSTATRLGEPVTLKIELTGSGNWGTLGDPQWPSSADWRMYSQDAHSQSDLENGQMTGKRTYEQLWTPLNEGQVTIPAIQYSYFDPGDGQYHSIATQPQVITVAPGDPKLAASQPQVDPAADQPAADQAAPAATPQDLKPVPAVLTSAAAPLAQQTGFTLLFLVPLGLVAGDLALAYRKHYRTAHASDLRRSQAYKRARRQLQKVSPRARNAQIEVSHILMAYLEDLIQQPLTGLPHSTLAQILQTQRFSPELARRVIAALFVGEASEYAAQQTTTHAEIIRTAIQLLDDLEAHRNAILAQDARQ